MDKEYDLSCHLLNKIVYNYTTNAGRTSCINPDSLTYSSLFPNMFPINPRSGIIFNFRKNPKLHLKIRFISLSKLKITLPLFVKLYIRGNEKSNYLPYYYD